MRERRRTPPDPACKLMLENEGVSREHQNPRCCWQPGLGSYAGSLPAVLPSKCETLVAASGGKINRQPDATSSQNTWALLLVLGLSLYVAPIETDVKLRLYLYFNSIPPNFFPKSY